MTEHDPQTARDTQWPRWEVFKQDAADKPHQAVGSVHATDAQLALLAARNVFVRRPSAHSIWVAPASAILAKTAEQLEAEANKYRPSGSGAKATYHLFRKTSHRRSMTFVDHAGTLEARSAEEALKLGAQAFAGEPALAWWVVADEHIHASDQDPDTIASWFEPANDKTYRQQAYYASVGLRPRQRSKPGES